ncbi:type II toxin-antitoxin system BrnA family antitoxin [Rubneribacter sp.]
MNVDFPEWMIDELDREAKRVGINRQAAIKTWIAERIDRTRASRSA